MRALRRTVPDLSLNREPSPWFAAANQRPPVQWGLGSNNADTTIVPDDAFQYDLVSFEHPPVEEVVLSVQFAPQTLDVEAFGRFAAEVHEELPERQQQPVLPPMTETFERVTAPPSLEIRLEPTMGLPRMWFLSSSGVELAQLQHDRFTFNWREAQPGVEYPRYSTLRERFRDLLRRLIAALEESGRAYAVNLCEVTYVNTISLPDGNDHPQLADIINRIGQRPEGAFLPPAEDAQLVVRYRIPGSESGKDPGSPIGRLYLQASPGVKPSTLAPIYLVNLTARVIARAGDIEGAMQALDVGHKWVVLGFKDLTTSDMHRLWGLKEEGRDQ